MRLLEGQVVTIAAGGTALDAPLAGGLADAGAEVIVVGPTASAVLSDLPGGVSVRAVDGPTSTRESMNAILESARLPGGPRGIVHTGTGAPEPGPVTACDDATWDERCEAPLRAALACAQAAFDHLGGGGALVYITPTVTLTGASGLVPYVTALEGVRALAKSAARQWGAGGITVNCVAPALAVVAPGVAASDPAVAEAALGGPPDPRTGVAPVVAWLLSPLARAVTGLTIALDGGVVMAP